MHEKGWPDDIYEHIDQLTASLNVAKSIEEVEAAWVHFYRVESYIEIHWPHDRLMIDTCRRLNSALSTYTNDVRQKMPSPYTGWRVVLSSLRRQVGPRYGPDGYPLP